MLIKVTKTPTEVKIVSLDQLEFERAVGALESFGRVGAANSVVLSVGNIRVSSYL